MAGWRYRAGLLLIGAAGVIWVTSAGVTQGIFTDYKQPFAVTYLGASLMVVYLPIALIKDWMCNMLRKHSSKGGKSVKFANQASGTNSPVKYTELMKIIQIESQPPLNRKESDLGLSAQREEIPFIMKLKDDVDGLRESGELTTWDIAKYGFYMAPIWFITEYDMFSLKKHSHY